MNATNRALNRILLLVVGLLLVGVGAALVLVVAWPAATPTWEDTIARVDRWLAAATDATLIGEGPVSWLAVGALAAIVVAIVLLVVAVVRLGGGRSRAVLQASSSDNPLGRVVVRDAFAADALTHALTARSDVVSARVTAAVVRAETVMHISVTPHRNTSPRVIALEVDRLASNLAVLTGRDLPTYVSIRAGLRARLTPERRDLA